jgi:hypothetical protein
MSHRRGFTVALASLALFVVSFAGPAASATPAVFIANLRGGEREAPDLGDPDAKGTALIGVAVQRERVCWVIDVRNIELPATAAHIHAGAREVAGPVVVTLSPPDEAGVSAGCTEVTDRALLKDIKQHSRRYYVNVHNDPYPNGALRGQLLTFQH